MRDRTRYQMTAASERRIIAALAKRAAEIRLANGAYDLQFPELVSLCEDERFSRPRAVALDLLGWWIRRGGKAWMDDGSVIEMTLVARLFESYRYDVERCKEQWGKMKSALRSAMGDD